MTLRQLILKAVEFNNLDQEVQVQIRKRDAHGNVTDVKEIDISFTEQNP